MKGDCRALFIRGSRYDELFTRDPALCHCLDRFCEDYPEFVSYAGRRGSVVRYRFWPVTFCFPDVPKDELFQKKEVNENGSMLSARRRLGQGDPSH